MFGFFVGTGRVVSGRPLPPCRFRRSFIAAQHDENNWWTAFTAEENKKNLVFELVTAAALATKIKP